MRIIISSLVIFVFGSIAYSEIEYGYFVRPDDAEFPETYWPTGQTITNEYGSGDVAQSVQLDSGDQFVFLSIDPAYDVRAGVNIQFYGTTNRPAMTPVIFWKPDVTDSIESRTIVGPCSISPFGETTKFMCYKIIRSEDPASSSAGNFQVVVEQSTNLESWNTALIMSHDSTNQDQVFFRTRLVPVDN